MRCIAFQGSFLRLIVASGDGAIDLEVTDHTLDAVALAIEAFAVADRHLAVRFGRDDGFDAALFKVIADCVAVVGLVGNQGGGRLFR